MGTLVPNSPLAVDLPQLDSRVNPGKEQSGKLSYRVSNKVGRVSEHSTVDNRHSTREDLTLARHCLDR